MSIAVNCCSCSLRQSITTYTSLAAASVAVALSNSCLPFGNLSRIVDHRLEREAAVRDRLAIHRRSVDCDVAGPHQTFF